MDNFCINKNTEFYLFVTNQKLSCEYRTYINKVNPKEMMISSPAWSKLNPDDIIFLYIKGKTSGFFGLVQIKTEQITNEEYIIYNDNNLNKYCYGIEEVILFDDIHYDQLDLILLKKAFVCKYLRSENLFKSLDYPFGCTLFNEITKVMNSKPISISIPDLVENVENEIETTDNVESDIKINDDGNIPFLIVLCNLALEGIQEDSDKAAEILFNHVYDCDACDITDNGEVRLKLLPIWKNLEFEYDDVDSNYPELTAALAAYHSMNRYNPFNCNDSPKIKILNIAEQDNLYNECILIVSNIPKLNSDKNIKAYKKKDQDTENEITIDIDSPIEIIPEKKNKKSSKLKKIIVKGKKIDKKNLCQVI